MSGQRVTRVDLTGERVDAVLAALRFFQHQRAMVSRDIEGIASNGGAHPPLDNNAIDDLCELINAGRRDSEATLCTEDDRPDWLSCPSCGNENLRYLEDIVCYRRVREIVDGALQIDAAYETGEGYDDGDNARLECRSCLEEFDIPAGLELDFV